jgi:hypothetical protein
LSEMIKQQLERPLSGTISIRQSATRFGHTQYFSKSVIRA